MTWPTEIALSTGDRKAILELARAAGLASPVRVTYSAGVWFDGPSLTVSEADHTDAAGWSGRLHLSVSRREWLAGRILPKTAHAGPKDWVAAKRAERTLRKSSTDEAGSFEIAIAGDVDTAVAEHLIAAVRGHAFLIDKNGAVLAKGLRDRIPLCPRSAVSWSPERSLFYVTTCVDVPSGTGYSLELREQGILVQLLSACHFIV